MRARELAHERGPERLGFGEADVHAETWRRPAHLALGDGHAHRLLQIVDRAGRDALHIDFLHHGGECLLGHPAWLQETREVGALTQLGNAQLDRAGGVSPGSVG